MKNIKVNKIILILFFINFKLFSMEIKENSNLKQDINLLAKKVQDTYDNSNNNINMIESKKKFDPIKGQNKRLHIILKNEDIDTKIKLLYKFISDNNIDLSKFILEYLLKLLGYEFLIQNKNLFEDLLKNKIIDLNNLYFGGKTILMYGIENNYLDFVISLLDNDINVNNIDINKQDVNGNTILAYILLSNLELHYKSICKLTKLRKILNIIKKIGINKNIVNNNNKLAEDIAKEKNFRVFELLSANL